MKVTLKDEIKAWFVVTFNPSFWISIHKTNKTMDTIVRRFIENPPDGWYECKDEHRISLEGYKIWVANYPCSYGQVYTTRYSSDGLEELPSRRTRYLLNKFITEYENNLLREVERKQSEELEKLL